MPNVTPTVVKHRNLEPRHTGVALDAPPRLLILSNGHGEDSMGALLGSALRERCISVSAFPLVGEGRAYQAAGISITGEQANMPSGGFILEGSNAIWQDLRAGLLSLTWRQIRALSRLGQEYDCAIGVGDVFPLAMNACFLRRPFVFIPTAKSDYIRPHYVWEAALMRRSCKYVFPRDAKTAESLCMQGVPAEYAGNLMMDALTFTGKRFNEGKQVVGILPGSREPEAYNNTKLLLGVVKQLVRMAGLAGADAPGFVLAMAGSLSHTKLATAIREQNWQWQASTPEEVAEGIVGWLTQPGTTVKVALARGRFGDVLASSAVVLGMSGTGNEQAAGMGVPVLTLPGPGPQFTSHFAKDQARLLGSAVMVVEEGPSSAAEALWALLQDPQRRSVMGEVGRERMGAPGATVRIANCIVAMMQATSDSYI